MMHGRFQLIFVSHGCGSQRILAGFCVFCVFQHQSARFSAVYASAAYFASFCGLSRVSGLSLRVLVLRSGFGLERLSMSWCVLETRWCALRVPVRFSTFHAFIYFFALFWNILDRLECSGPEHP